MFYPCILVNTNPQLASLAKCFSRSSAHFALQFSALAGSLPTHYSYLSLSFSLAASFLLFFFLFLLLFFFNHFFLHLPQKRLCNYLITRTFRDIITNEPPVAIPSPSRPPLLSDQFFKIANVSKSNRYIWNLL